MSSFGVATQFFKTELLITYYLILLMFFHHTLYLSHTTFHLHTRNERQLFNKHCIGLKFSVNWVLCSARVVAVNLHVYLCISVYKQEYIKVNKLEQVQPIFYSYKYGNPEGTM